MWRVYNSIICLLDWYLMSSIMPLAFTYIACTFLMFWVYFDTTGPSHVRFFFFTMTFSLFFTWIMNLLSGFRHFDLKEIFSNSLSSAVWLKCFSLFKDYSLLCVFVEILYDHYFIYLLYSQIIFKSFIQQLRFSIVIHL